VGGSLVEFHVPVRCIGCVRTVYPFFRLIWY
jgi:hypothetical protein